MKLRIPRTTFGLAAMVSAVLAALAVVSGLVGQNVAHEELERQLDHRIAAESSLLTEAYERGGLSSLVPAIEARRDRHEGSGLGYLLVDGKGHRLAGALQAEAPTKAGWREFLYVRDGDTHARSAHQALTVILPKGERLVVAADRMPVEEIDGVIAWITAGTTTVMLIMGMGGAWILGLITRRRIDEVSRVANAITEGDIARRIPQENRAGEFDRLAETLNRMLDRNAELLANLKQVSTDIAHDLRTPLGRLQQQLELALAECEDTQGYRRAIERAVAAAAEIQQIFSALLKISEIESLTLRESFVAVSLSEIADRVTDAFRPDIEEHGRHLIVDNEPGLHVMGERHLLSQLLVNLIENAMRHTPAGTTIRVGLRCDGPYVVLTAQDDGPGIPAAERARVMERFVRLEASRSTQGHGLGLSLVRAIATAHGAALEIEDCGPGLLVRIRFNALPAGGDRGAVDAEASGDGPHEGPPVAAPRFLDRSICRARRIE